MPAKALGCSSGSMVTISPANASGSKLFAQQLVMWTWGYRLGCARGADVAGRGGRSSQAVCEGDPALGGFGEITAHFEDDKSPPTTNGQAHLVVGLRSAREGLVRDVQERPTL